MPAEQRVSPQATQIRFVSRYSGDLIARRQSDGRLALDFPSDDGAATSAQTSGADFDRVSEAVVSACPEMKGKVVAIGRSDFLGLVIEIDSTVDLVNAKVDAAPFVSPSCDVSL